MSGAKNLFNTTDMPLWKPFTESDPGRMIFADTTAFSNKGPDALMTFLVGNYLKSHEKDVK